MENKIRQLAKQKGQDFEELDFLVKAYMKHYSVDEQEAYDHFDKGDIKIIHLSEIAEKQGKVELVKTGLGFLDDAMGGGITKGGSMVVAAMAGEGKTTFMQSVSYHFAKQNVPCLWFSYEENINAIWDRFKKMGLTDKHLMFAPMDLEDNKIDYIERAIKKYKREHEFFVVFIDQLSNIAPKIDGKTNVENLSKNFALYLGIMSTQLKEVAMKYGIIVVIAHQLGRSGELAYSDMVRHAPDKVIFLEREHAAGGGQDKFTDKTFMKMNKNRPIGTAPIVPMRVIKNRFVHHDSNDFIEDAREMMNKKITLNIK
jgi:predicted ATP-dependent serine protease